MTRPHQDAAEIAEIDSEELSFILWVGEKVRHIDVVSKPRLRLVRKGMLDVATRECCLYASLTPLGLAIHASQAGDA